MYFVRLWVDDEPPTVEYCSAIFTNISPDIVFTAIQYGTVNWRQIFPLDIRFYHKQIDTQTQSTLGHLRKLKENTKTVMIVNHWHASDNVISFS